jgi:hypothetical protein
VSAEELIGESGTTSGESSSSNGRSYTIEMHPSFRLFGTQNPSVGQYKGMRQAQNSSTLVRFSPYMVEAPSQGELADTCQQILARNGVKMSVKPIIDCHFAIQKLTSDAKFSERLMRYDLLTWYYLLIVPYI